MEIKAKDIRLVDVDSLIPNPKNNNKHPKEQIERLSKLIKYQGFRNPLVVSNRSGFVLCGHGRIEAAKMAGLKEVPVMYQDFESEAQEYAYLTSDNAIASWSELDLSAVNTEMLDLGPDFDIDLLGIKDFVIEPIEKFDPQSDEDEVPEVVHPITRKGDIWLLGNHRLMCGDSTMIDDVEKLMNGEKADMVFTDPPYGMAYKSNAWDSSIVKSKSTSREIAGDNSVEVGNDAISLIPNLTKEKCHIFIWCRWDSFENFRNQAEMFSDVKGNIVWDKGDSPGLGDLECSFGGNELAVHSIIGRPKIKKRINSVWRANRPKGLSMVHPTQKPIEIIEPALENCTIEKNLILDLFLGSGSTLIACEKTNRKCYGMELDEKYCDVIINRWQNYTGKKAVLESTKQTYEELKQERGA